MMDTRAFRCAALVLTAAALATTTARADDRPSPGLYEVETRTEYANLPMPPTTVTTKNCLTQEILDQDPETIFAGLPEEENCEVETFTMAGGQIAMKLVCLTDQGDMTMKADGSYSAGGYSMASTVLIEVGGKQMQMASTIRGTRLGECAAGGNAP